MCLGQETLGKPKDQSWAGWSPGQAGRPPWSAAQAHGAHRLKFDVWQLLTSSQGRFQGIELQSLAESTMAPSYIYDGRGLK